MRGEWWPGRWRELGRWEETRCHGQSGCPTALGSPCPASRAQWGLSCRILGSCTGLMQAIHVLVLASKDLQREIVESGRVSWGQGCRRGAGRTRSSGCLASWGSERARWGRAAPRIVPLGHQYQLPRAPAPSLGSHPGCGPQGVTEVPDLPSHVGDTMAPRPGFSVPSSHMHPK